jgi:hypothetical protein
MKRQKFIILIYFLLPLFFLDAASLYAQTRPAYYYVSPDGKDSNPGTESLPWKTMARATSMATAGTTVFIMQGTYNERLIPVNSGTVEKPVIFASYPGDTVTLTGAGIDFQPGPVNDKWWNGIIQIQDLNHIKISGLRVINSDASGIVVIGGNYITIEKNYTDSTYSPGIEINTSENVIVEANEVVHACMGGDQECISISLTNRFEIKNNRVHDGFTEGIDVKVGCSNGIIAMNEVYNQKYRFGIYLDANYFDEFNIDVFDNISHDNFHGIAVSTENVGLIERIKVHHNLVYNNDQKGLWVAGGGGVSQTHRYKNIEFYCNTIYKNLIGLNLIAFAGTDIDSLRIFNNLIFQNTSAGIYTNFEQPAGQYVLRNIEILNNTIYANGTSINSWGDGGINITGIVPENLLIRNNILSGNAAYTICVQPDVPADSVTIDYNFFDGFQNFLHETVGTNPVYGNPLFVDYLTNDYHLQVTSTAIDKGNPDQQYNDPADPNKPGYALSPSQGTIRNDMGAYGGPFASSWDLAASVATPSAPTLILPSNSETGVPATLLLNWNGPWGAISYQLQVSTSSDFSSLVINQSSIKGQSYGIRDLEYNTLYYWRVKANNAGGTGSYSTIWKFTTFGPTFIEQNNPEIPSACTLYQNYPNPFNQITSIQFFLPKESHVKLTIFNSLGKEIEVLVNHDLTPGQYHVQWIPNNNTSGIYFYRLQTSGFIDTKKFILQR